MTDRVARVDGGDRSRWSFAGFVLDLDAGELRGPDGPLAVEPKSLEVLAALCRRSGELCSREELLEKVWVDRFVTEEVLTHCIWELRKALGDDARRPTFIKTVPRRGYRLLAQVEEDAAVTPATDSPEPSIAVLPFADFSADGADQYLADGLSEELIFELSRCPGLRAVCRTSCFRFRDTQLEVADIGEQLGVAFLLEGSVRRGPSRVRTTVRLIDVAAGRDHWAARFDREPTDLIELQEEIARRVADEVAGRLQPRPGSVPSNNAQKLNAEAFELYLRGRYHFQRRTESSLQSAVAAFEQSRALSPESSRPLTGLSACYLLLGFYGSYAPSEIVARVDGLARRALELDPESAAALATLGLIESLYRWRWSEAETAFEQSIALDSDYSNCRLWYALNCLLPQGRIREAEEQLERAIVLDPLDGVLLSSRGILQYYSQRSAEAVRSLDLALELDPQFSLALQFRGLARLDLGDSGALADLDLAVEASGASDETIAALAHARARIGDPDGARRGLEELVVRSEGRYVSAVLKAQIYAGLEEWESAVVAVEQAFEEGAPGLVFVARRPTFRKFLELHSQRLDFGRLGLGASEA